MILVLFIIHSPIAMSQLPDLIIDHNGIRLLKIKFGLTLEEYLIFFVGNDAPAAAEKTAESDTLYPKGANEITGAEVIGYRKSVFKAIDANGDGKVTPDELKAYNNKEFEFLDKNKDGFVTVDEISAVAVIPVFLWRTGITSCQESH